MADQSEIVDAFDQVILEAHGLKTYILELIEEAERQKQARQRGIAWTRTDICHKFDDLQARVQHAGLAVDKLRD